MADSQDTTGLSQPEHLGHPTDNIGLALGRANAMLLALEGCYNGAKDGQFNIPQQAIFVTLTSISDEITGADAELDRLNYDYVVPFHPKAGVKS